MFWFNSICVKVGELARRETGQGGVTVFALFLGVLSSSWHYQNMAGLTRRPLTLKRHHSVESRNHGLRNRPH